MIDADAVGEAIGTASSGLNAGPARSRCSILHEGGKITVSFLMPSSFGDITATEAFEVEHQKYLQQHFDVVGEPELGDGALVLHLDDARDVVMVRSGDEVLVIEASFTGSRVVDDEAIVRVAEQLAEALEAANA